MSDTVLHRALLLGVFIALAGAVFVGGGLLGWWGERQRAGWPQAAGRLVSVKLAQVDQARRSVEAARSLRPDEASYQLQAAWTVLVDYEFDLQGQRVHGDRLAHKAWLEPVAGGAGAPSAALQAVARQLAEQQAAGRPVPVYYRPDDPQDNFLLQRPHASARRALWLGGALLALGGGLAGWARAQRRPVGG
jgi:Protein of unknown function (DUF3592)